MSRIPPGGRVSTSLTPVRQESAEETHYLVRTLFILNMVPEGSKLENAFSWNDRIPPLLEFEKIIFEIPSSLHILEELKDEIIASIYCGKKVIAILTNESDAKAAGQHLMFRAMKIRASIGPVESGKNAPIMDYLKQGANQLLWLDSKWISVVDSPIPKMVLAGFHVGEGLRYAIFCTQSVRLDGLETACDLAFHSIEQYRIKHEGAYKFVKVISVLILVLIFVTCIRFNQRSINRHLGFMEIEDNHYFRGMLKRDSYAKVSQSDNLAAFDSIAVSSINSETAFDFGFLIILREYGYYTQENDILVKLIRSGGKHASRAASYLMHFRRSEIENLVQAGKIDLARYRLNQTFNLNRLILDSTDMLLPNYFLNQLHKFRSILENKCIEVNGYQTWALISNTSINDSASTTTISSLADNFAYQRISSNDLDVHQMNDLWSEFLRKFPESEKSIEAEFNIVSNTLNASYGEEEKDATVHLKNAESMRAAIRFADLHSDSYLADDLLYYVIKSAAYTGNSLLLFESVKNLANKHSESDSFKRLMTEIAKWVEANHSVIPMAKMELPRLIKKFTLFGESDTFQHMKSITRISLEEESLIMRLTNLNALSLSGLKNKDLIAKIFKRWYSGEA